MDRELIIQNGDTIYYPVVEDSVKWDVDRFGTPGKLTFRVLNDADLNIEEGNAVRFKSDGKNVFYGFIFKLKADEDLITITAYDQLRYLKNKDTLVYKDLTGDGLVRRIAKEFNLRTGKLANMGYVIPPRVEDNQTLIDMVKTTQDLTLKNTGKLYVLYDDFGSIKIEDIEDMRLDILLDDETTGAFSLDSSIDASTYNKIKLVKPNEETGTREVYIAQDSGNINRWGVLQYYDTLKDGENGKAKADALLKLYNQKNRVFTANNVLGDVRVRGGSSVIVRVKYGSLELRNYMVVDSVQHVFSDNAHFMNLKLRGGA